LNKGEDPLVAAQREFREEIGFPAAGNFIPLSAAAQMSGKTVLAWAVEGLELSPRYPSVSSGMGDDATGSS